MKADKGNCFVVMDRSDYDNKIETLLNDRSTYEIISTSPFRRIEREVNAMLLSLKKEQKIDEPTYRKLHSTDGTPPVIRGSVKHHKEGNPQRPIVTCIGSAPYNTSKFLTGYPFSGSESQRILCCQLLAVFQRIIRYRD